MLVRKTPSLFTLFAKGTSRLAGRPATFTIALLVIAAVILAPLVWLFGGPLALLMLLVLWVAPEGMVGAWHRWRETTSPRSRPPCS